MTFRTIINIPDILRGEDLFTKMLFGADYPLLVSSRSRSYTVENVVLEIGLSSQSSGSLISNIEYNISYMPYLETRRGHRRRRRARTINPTPDNRKPVDDATTRAESPRTTA